MLAALRGWQGRPARVGVAPALIPVISAADRLMTSLASAGAGAWVGTPVPIKQHPQPSQVPSTLPAAFICWLVSTVKPSKSSLPAGSPPQHQHLLLLYPALLPVCQP